MHTQMDWKSIYRKAYVSKEADLGSNSKVRRKSARGITVKKICDLGSMLVA